MKPQPYYTFNIHPLQVARAPKSGETPSFKYKMYQKYLKKLRSLARAKKFVLSQSFKVIFIIPMIKDIDEKVQQEYIGKPHTTGQNTLPKLVEAVKVALMDDTINTDFYRVDASKYWGASGEGKVILRNLIAEDFEYLRQMK